MRDRLENEDDSMAGHLSSVLEDGAGSSIRDLLGETARVLEFNEATDAGDLAGTAAMTAAVAAAAAALAAMAASSASLRLRVRYGPRGLHVRTVCID